MNYKVQNIPTYIVGANVTNLISEETQRPYVGPLFANLCTPSMWFFLKYSRKTLEFMIQIRKSRIY